tara:strand:+ start:12409 stop:12900 length:492 start_codon:yes stop_codon:yes gene_type:complete
MESKIFKEKKFFNRPSLLIATCFGLGFFPFAPGTIGSIVATILAWPISFYLGSLGLFIASILVILFGLCATHYYSKSSDTKDSPTIIIDEVGGQWLTLVLIPPDPIYYLIGFVLFRLLDVTKPWPINVIDSRMKGSIGVMLDDIIAGIISALILWNIWIWLDI